ncbi:MAG TPA: lipid II flippase MurJ [Planctomycetota bacterium]
MWRGLLRAGAIVSGGILLGRVLGFVREVVLAHKLGAGPAADVAVYALTLPDVFTNLLVSGAVSAALIPEFKAGPATARALFIRATGLSFLAFGALAALGAFAAEALARVLAPGFPSETAAGAAALGSRTLASLPLTAAAAISTAYLHSRDRFALPALGTLIFNAGVVATLAGWIGPDRLGPLGWGVLIAAGARWCAQLAQALPLPRGEGALEAPVGGSVFRRYAEALASFGALVLVNIVARAMASWHGVGAVAAINYAQKIVELPMGLAVGVLGVVLLPRFAELHARGADAETSTLARQGVWLVWVLALPATFGLAWYADPVIDLLFGHGRMSPDAADRIGRLSALSLLGLPAQGLCVLLFALLSARKDTARPLRAGFALFALYAAAAWLGQKRLGLEGLVIAGVAFQWALAVAYVVILKRWHAIDLLTGPFARDLGVAALVAVAGFVPVALAVSRAASPKLGVAAALVGGALAFAAALAPRYRELPDGLRTFTRARPA